MEVKNPEHNSSTNSAKSLHAVQTGAVSKPYRKAGKAVPYFLFLYKSEVRNPKARYLDVCEAKRLLTKKLIRNCSKKPDRYSDDDLDIISQQKIYKKSLKRQVSKIKKALSKQIMEKYSKSLHNGNTGNNTNNMSNKHKESADQGETFGINEGNLVQISR